MQEGLLSFAVAFVALVIEDCKVWEITLHSAQSLDRVVFAAVIYGNVFPDAAARGVRDARENLFDGLAGVVARQEN
jgi:hypothetical protein